MKKRVFSLLLVAVMLFANVQCVFANSDSTESQIKNIIYMIPDGGGMASFFLADYVKQAGGLNETFPNATPVETGEMYIKQYLVGSETTHSASDAITDSAASGTALSSGYKTTNSYVGVDPNKKPHANLLEASQEAGKNTGMVVTYEWTNATPATFSAHCSSRYGTLDIAEQIVNQGIDVVFGNTDKAYIGEEWFTDKALEERGYRVIKEREELADVKAGDRLWAKLPTAYYDILKHEKAPNLAELTEAAIRALDDGNENGFFLMVEGSAVDGGGHDSNALRMVSEWLAFDEACKVAIEFAKKRTDTLVVILPDHDTGGMRAGSTNTSSNLEAYVSQIQAGTEPSSIIWEGNGGHTARNGGIFMYVPEGVPYPTGIDPTRAPQVLAEFKANTTESTANRIDNTAIALYLANFIGINLDELTQELFVDVTDKGTMDANGEVFTFTNDAGATVEVEKNASRAMVDGTLYGLDGQVTVYENNRFYVPEKLLNTIAKEASISIFADYNKKSVNISGTTNDAASTVTMIVTDPGVVYDDSLVGTNIAYVEEVTTSYQGDYELNFSVPDAKIGDYNYYTKFAGLNGTKEYNFFFRDMVIEKNGQAVEEMSDLQEGDDIDLVIGGYDSSYEGYAFLGQYDEDGRLITCKTTPVKGGDVGTGIADSEAEISEKVVKGTNTIKAFYWSYDMVPFVGGYAVE